MVAIANLLKNLAKQIIPPILFNHLKRLKPRKHGWFGNFKSWEDAAKLCTGFDSKIVLEKVSASLKQVRDGHAVYERDSVLFNEIHYSWPLTAALMWIAAQSDGELAIVDFGGSLGSTYYQNKLFLSSLKKVTWNIVEQRQFVDHGKLKFQNESLRFFNSLESCLQDEKVDAILLSCVIQYLQNPHKCLDEILSKKIKFIVIDRMALLASGKDRLTVQKVPPFIYPASYPCWFLNKEGFYSKITKDYTIVARFNALDRADIRDSVYEGCIAVRKGFV